MLLSVYLTPVMKKGIHAQDYRPVVVQDTNSGYSFLTRITAKTAETVKWEDGKEYPLFKVHISSASHPYYTGEEKIVDVEGRVDRFKARQAEAQKRQQHLRAKTVKTKSRGRNSNKDRQKVAKVGQDLNASKNKRESAAKTQ